MKPDYEDHFTVATTARAEPEQWARAMFGNVPNAGQVLIWSVLLGLRLHRGPSPDTVAGWRIGERGDDWIRLDAASRFMSAHLLVRTAEGQVSLTTLVHYDRPPARVIWPPASAVHRRLIPGVLGAAAARVAR